MIEIKDNIFKSLGASNHIEEERASLDYYATDPAALVDLLEVYPQIVNENFKYLEPCAGEGNISDKFYELTGIKMGGYVCSFQKLLQLESKNRYDKIYSKYKPETVFIYTKRRSCWKNNDSSRKDGAVCYSWVVWHKTEDMKNTETKLKWIFTE